jgi:Flp pilus assembly protein TadD
MHLIPGLAIAAMLAAASLFAAPSMPDKAAQQYQATDYRGAVRTLDAVANKDGPAYFLLGKSWYMLGDYKKSTDVLSKAVAAEPNNSEYYNWLGKAYGRRAENSSPFTAPVYAGRTREAFEKAVALDGQNKEALNDLFEYYLEAPGFLGGGTEKAAGLVPRIGKLDPAEAYYAHFRLAEKRKDFEAAEQNLRKAMEAAPKQVGRIIDLAAFLGRRGRAQESEQLFAKARAMAPNAPKVLFAEAESYVNGGRNLEKARQLLREFLSAKLTPDDPPRAEAEKLLRKLGA